MSLDFGYAAPQWGAGLSINGGMDRVVDTKSFALSVSAGAVCTPVPKHLSLGLAVFNIGATTPYLDTMETLSKGPALPLSVRLGTSWKDSLREISYTAALDVVYRDIDERVLVPVGLEIYPIDFLALRIGKEFNHDTEIFNCGLGIYINYLNLNVDISTVYAKFGEFKYLLSLTYRLIS